MSLTRPMFRLTLLSTLITATTVSFAAESVPETTLGSLTVTATRSPTLVQNTIAQTTVIDEADLQRYQGQNVLEVLKHQPGFSFYQSGGQGTVSNFWLRGYSGKQVLVLVNGIRYSSMTTGVTALNLIPADQVERIEVLYGASGSSLYGSEAMGGVIQIFTKGQMAAQSNVALTLGAGSQESYQAQVTGQYITDKTTLSLSAGHEQTDGFNATLPSAFAFYPDKDGYDSDNGSLFIKHQLTETTDIGLSGVINQSTTDTDNGAAAVISYDDQKNAIGTAFLHYQKDSINTSLTYGESIDEVKSHAGANLDTFKTRQRQANWQMTYDLPLGKVIGGLDWLKQKADVNSLYNSFNQDRTVKSGFIGYQIAQPNYDFQAHVRYDDNSQYDSETTYNIGGAYRLMPDLRVGASYATGFRAPTLNDLYAKSSYFNGNPDLIPETSDNAEVFMEYTRPNQTTRLTGYWSDIEDGINYNNNYSTMVNIDKSKIKGVTLTSDWDVNNVLFGGNYDYQETEDKATGKELVYHPTHKGLVYVGYRLPEFDIRAEAQYMGDSYTNAANTDTLKGYTLINLSGNYYINPNLTINARLNNLADKQYQTIKGYQMPGINSFVSLTYKWF